MEKLGKMNFSNFNKGETNIENGNNILFNEKINFILMPSNYCHYLKKYIEDNIIVTGNFNKGKCFLFNEFNIKKEEKDKKLFILEKRNGNNVDEFEELIIELKENEDIKTFINKIKNKTFEELINDKNLKIMKRES